MTDADVAALEDRLRRDAARRLVTCALMLQGEEMAALSVANPFPHDNPAPQGEYPRARTFNLRNGIWAEPLDLNLVAKTLRVSVGYAARAHYGAILARKGWEGLLDTLEKLRPRIRAVLQDFGTAATRKGP